MTSGIAAVGGAPVQAQEGSAGRVGALLATLITPTSVDLRWPEVPGVDGYAVSWRLSGADPSTTLSVFSSNNQRKIEDLQPSSTYVFQVTTVRERVIQAGSVSAPLWAATLPQVPDSPSPLGAEPFVPVQAGTPVATSITPNTVDLRWPAVAGAGGYVVAWWKVSEERSDAKMLYAPGTSSTVTGLQPGTGYWIDVSYTRQLVVQSAYTSPPLRITTPGGSTGGGSGGGGGGGVSPPPPPPPPQGPAVSVSGGSAVTEGTAATFTITASPAPSAPLTVDITVTQTGDFVASAHRGTKQVTIPTGGSVTHTVPTVGDTVNEANGAVAVTINTGAGYNVAAPPHNTASVTVNDDDTPLGTPTVSVSGGSAVIEGGVATFTITASPAPSAPLTVDITVTQTGSFVASTHRGTKQVTIPTGGSVTHTVPTVGDTVNEANGAVAVTINTGAGYNVANPPANTASVTVIDDDTPTVSVSGGAAVTEGTAATFTITASPAPSAPLTVGITVTQSGSFVASTHRGAKQVTIPAGGSVTHTVPTIGDTVNEANGAVSVTINTGAGYNIAAPPQNTASITVNDDDTPTDDTPAVSVTAGSTVIEGTAATFTITALPAPSAPLTIGITVTQTGSFVASTHRGTKQVTIPTSGSITHTVPTIADTVAEANGAVAVTINTGAGYNVAAPPANTASVTVIDDDTPTVSVTAGAAVTEGTAAVFTITAGPAPSAPLTVGITVTQTGSFVASTHRGTKQVTIPTSGSITHTVPTIADTVAEANGAVAVTINTGAGYNIAAPPANAASITVKSDDLYPTPTGLTASCNSGPVLVASWNAITVGGDPFPGGYLVRAKPFPGGDDDHWGVGITAATSIRTGTDYWSRVNPKTGDVYYVSVRAVFRNTVSAWSEEVTVNSCP